MAGFDPAFESKLMALVAASGGRLKIKSGYRSTARQSALWNAALAEYGSAAKARKWVAPPGKSNHEKGQAADLGGDLKWAHANAARFGLHFPMKHEAWHVEPVGLRGAKAGHTPAPAGHSADDGHAHGAAPTATATAAPEVEKTWEFQMQSLGQILMGGGDTDGAVEV